MPQQSIEVVFIIRVQPCIASSGPYESIKEKAYKEFLENKKKWIGKKDFSTVLTRVIKPSYIQNYVVRDPSDPPTLHKFRIANKDKWIAGNFFV